MPVRAFQLERRGYHFHGGAYLLLIAASQELRSWYAAAVEQRHHMSAARARWSIERGLHDSSLFRAALLSVPSSERDAWLDLVLALDELPDDGPELPRGCVPYLPCSVDALLRVVELAGVRASDVFVDIGSGLGRAATLVHLLTGASAVGLEIQPALALTARRLASRLLLTRVPCIEGDAAKLTGFVTIGTVFFLYCPFGGERLVEVLDQLESIARTKMLRVCCVDLPLPPRAWLTPDPVRSGDLAVYRSTLHPRTRSTSHLHDATYLCDVEPRTTASAAASDTARDPCRPSIARCSAER